MSLQIRARRLQCAVMAGARWKHTRPPILPTHACASAYATVPHSCSAWLNSPPTFESMELNYKAEPTLVWAFHQPPMTMQHITAT